MFRLSEAEVAAIELPATRDDTGDRAESHAHARRTRIDEARQRVREHRRVELPRLAVDIEIGAREARREPRRSELGPGAEPRIHKTVFGAAQGHGIGPA